MYWVVPLRKSLLAAELSTRDGKNIQPIISGPLEADSDILFDALGFLKELLLTLQRAIVEKEPNLKIIMKNLRIIMTNFIQPLWAVSQREPICQRVLEHSLSQLF